MNFFCSKKNNGFVLFIQDLTNVVLLGLASFGTTELNFRVQSPFHQMVFFVFSLSKPFITNLKHARRCVAQAVSRMSTDEKTGLFWVLMYIFFFYFSLSLIFCIRTGYHRSRSEAQLHYTVRGFDHNGFAHKTIHVFSNRHSVVFPNGGKVWKSGCRAIRFQAECEVLW